MSDVEAASRRRLMEARSKNHSASRLRKASASFSHCDFQKGGVAAASQAAPKPAETVDARPHATQNLLSSLPPSPAWSACLPAAHAHATNGTNQCRTDRQASRAAPRPTRRARALGAPPNAAREDLPATHDRRQRRLLRVQQAGAAPCDLIHCRMFCSLLVRFGELWPVQELVPPAFCTFRH